MSKNPLRGIWLWAKHFFLFFLFQFCEMDTGEVPSNTSGPMSSPAFQPILCILPRPDTYAQVAVKFTASFHYSLRWWKLASSQLRTVATFSISSHRLESLLSFQDVSRLPRHTISTESHPSSPVPISSHHKN